MELNERIQKAITRRDAAQSNVQVLRGKLEAAQTEKERIEEQCRSKGVDPSRLDEALEKLEAKLKSEVEQFEAKLSLAEEKLTVFGKMKNEIPGI